MDSPEELEILDPMLQHHHHKNLMAVDVLQNVKLHNQEDKDHPDHLDPMASLDPLDHLHQQVLDHQDLLVHPDPMDNLEAPETQDHLVLPDNSQKVRKL